MKKVITLASSVILATSVGTAFASHPGTHAMSSTPTAATHHANKALAKKFVNSIQFNKMENKMAARMTQLSDAELSHSYPDISDKVVKQITDINKQAIHEIFTSPDFHKNVVSIYAKNFTKKELQALIKFSSTKEGKAVLNKLPSVNNDISRSVFKNLMKQMPEISKKQEAILKQHGYLKNQSQGQKKQ